MPKRPAFLLYTGDWLKDTALRCCSLEARGLWIEMLCYMHDCVPYGYLKVNQKVILINNLSAMVGVNLDDAKRLIKELMDAGVCQQLDDGTYYSKRMVKDEEVRLKRATGGHLGGNPILNKKGKKPKDNLNGYPSLESESESSFKIPTILEVMEYFKEKGYTEDSAKRAYEFYNVNNWKDSQNKKVKNWKMKMNSVWFKPENKIQEGSNGQYVMTDKDFY